MISRYALLPERVERAANASPTPLEHMRVDHCRRDIRMAQPFLHRANIVSTFQQVGGEGMAKRVRSRRLGDPRCRHRLLHRPLQPLLVEMMTLPLHPATRVDRVTARGKNLLPAPARIRRGVLALQGIRQVNGRFAPPQIVVEDLPSRSR